MYLVRKITFKNPWNNLQIFWSCFPQENPWIPNPGSTGVDCIPSGRKWMDQRIHAGCSHFRFSYFLFLYTLVLITTWVMFLIWQPYRHTLSAPTVLQPHNPFIHQPTMMMSYISLKYFYKYLMWQAQFLQFGPRQSWPNSFYWFQAHQFQ